MPGAFEVERDARRLVQGGHGLDVSLLRPVRVAGIQPADMVHAAGQRGEAVGGLGAEVPGVVEAVEQVADDLEPLLQHRQGDLDGHARLLSLAAAVAGDGLAELIGEAEVVHHQPAGLVLEPAVHPRDGLE